MGDYLSHPETTKHSDDGGYEGVGDCELVDEVRSLCDAGMAQDDGRHAYFTNRLLQGHVSFWSLRWARR